MIFAGRLFQFKLKTTKYFEKTHANFTEKLHLQITSLKDEYSRLLNSPKYENTVPVSI